VALADVGLGVAERLQRRGSTSLASRARAVTAALSGDRYAIEVDGVTVGGSVVHHGRYLRRMVRGGFRTPLSQLGVFAGALAPGMLVVDCGAHVGMHTVTAAKRVGPEGTVIALEPDPVNLKALRANVDANAVSDRVRIVEAAASDRPGSIRLHLDSNLDVSMRATSSIDPAAASPTAPANPRTARTRCAPRSRCGA
jgi:FkbM family methyltransferase